MNSASYIKIALFFIILGGAGAGYVVLSGDGMGFNTKTYEAVFTDATGLSTRSKVYLAGVPVGKVQYIELHGNDAKLTIKFLKHVEIRRDAVISRKSSSMLGTSILSLYPGTELSPIMPVGSVISSAPPQANMDTALVMVNDLGTQVTLLLEEFRTNQMALLAVTLETFNSIIKKVDDQSAVQLDRISRILEAAALISERTERMLKSGEGGISGSVADVREAMANLRGITGEIAAGRGNLGQVVYDERFYANLLAAAEKTDNAAGKLGAAIDNISNLAKNADGVVTNAGEIVNRALGLGIQFDANARYDFFARTGRASASIRLDPASDDRWYRIGVSSAPDGITSRTVRESSDSLGHYYRQDTSETKYSISVDAELARRFGFVTLRGGLLESTAGVGIDIQPIKWLSLSGELFNFQKGEYPNLRGTLSIYPFFNPDSNKFWNWIYLRGGINNALHSKRDFFIGGGLRFSDREIKGLIGLLPIFN